MALFVEPGTNGLTAIAGVTALALAIVGFIDDLRNLPAVPRLGAQITVGLLAAIACAVATGASGWVVPLGAVLITGYVNSTNFMDGINGISGLHGAIVGASFVVAGWLVHTTWLAVLGAILAAAFLAFVPWNLQRSGFFLGDVGSYLLGGAIATTATLAIAAGVSPLLVLAPLGIYVADTAVTMARRQMRGERIMSAHRSHSYQRLTDTGLSHLSVAALVTAFSAGSSAIAIIVSMAGVSPWLGWALIVGLCVVYLWIPRWRGSRLPSTGFVVPAAPSICEIPASPGHLAKRWAVVGASGFVGSAVVAYLSEQNVEISEISAPRLKMTAPTASDLSQLLEQAGIEAQRARLAEQFTGIDVVVNAAGMASPDSAGDDALYGANALLPAAVVLASADAGVDRIVHLSSAAVQGRRSRLDDSSDVAPFSPYSHSKALGERALLAVADRGVPTQVIVLRATSVQGRGRSTTESLIRLAHSPLASVAAPGTAPSATSSVTQLAQTVVGLGATNESVRGIVLQPWEGFTTRRVLEAAAPDRQPRMLPAWLCRTVVGMGFAAGRIVPRFTGTARRVEVMWFGQSQTPGWRQGSQVDESADLLQILGGA
ncbi:NAD-dependent epimerase/dehydratase family protein [Microbacterium sp. 2MCAF23]|uniref:NAD-dependent epimerase/dehydratase family protein n=1 Tax=Microbacterium sp. 2MCAF23 TaxID=3232985 RepID=UPI003F997F3C